MRLFTCTMYIIHVLVPTCITLHYIQCNVTSHVNNTTDVLLYIRLHTQHNTIVSHTS